MKNSIAILGLLLAGFAVFAVLIGIAGLSTTKLMPEPTPLQDTGLPPPDPAIVVGSSLLFPTTNRESGRCKIDHKEPNQANVPSGESCGSSCTVRHARRFFVSP